MKRAQIFFLSIFCLIGCKNKDVDSNLTAGYVGIWEASLPTEDKKHIWTIEKTGENQLKISIREHIEFNFEGYDQEKDENYVVENVKISNDDAPSFDFEKTVDDKDYNVEVLLSLLNDKLVATCKTIQKNTGESVGSPVLEFSKQE